MLAGDDIPVCAMSVRLLHSDAIPLAVIRRRVRRSELSTAVPEGCGTVWNYLRARGLRGGRHVAVYLNGQVDLEVGVEMDEAFDEGDGVVRSATPTGSVATATHSGPYEGLGVTHNAIQLWCRANGHALAGSSWEIYGHWVPEWNTDPSKIRTDVFYLLKTP